MGSKLRILRRLPGTYDENGRWMEGEPTVLDIIAVVQPLKSHEMVRVPEGRRTTGSVKLYSQTRLQTADAKKQRQPDRFCWNGDEYEVLSVDDWSQGGYYKAIAVEVGQ
jgi:hypothetical protein